MEGDMLDFAEQLQCQELHMRVDENTGLKAIIAIHNTLLGPALGGCRFIHYSSTNEAAIDAIRLAQGMSYKAAISNLPLGGGKMVILKPKILKNRFELFKEVGVFVDSLNGRYITAVDSGTSVEDMDIVSTKTKFVTSTSKGEFKEADPSLITALGVLKGILASIHFKFGNQQTLKGLSVAIQGLGHAGYQLAKLTYEMGAKLFVYDLNPDKMERCVHEFKAKKISNLDEIISYPADIFAPCALGGVLNDQTIPKIQAPIIAGCANNQLEKPQHGKMLNERGILYAPDYVINAGGLIYVSGQLNHLSEAVARKNVDGIYDTLLAIYERARRENKSTNEIADTIAEERLHLKNKE